MDMLSTWLTRNHFIPHGYCLTWTPGLLWSTVGADAVIAASYYSIPFALVHFVRKRSDFALNWVALLFSAFIFACGTTHLLAIWTVWQPYYGIETIAKLITAAVSLVTAVVLWPLLPKLIRIPSVAQLQSTVTQLEQEIRQRRAAETERIDLQESLTITLAGIGAAFVSTDRAGRIVRINPAAEAITGWRQAQAVGQSLLDVLKLSADDAPAGNPVDTLIGQSRTAETATRHQITTRGGGTMSIELNTAVMHGSDGAVRGMAVVFRDLSRLDQAQAESQQLASLVSSSGDAIIGTDIEGRIVSWNRAAEEMFGYPADEVVGRSISVLIPPERQAEGERTIARLRQGFKTPPFDTVRRRRDGTTLHVSVTVSPILDRHGAVTGASKIARDITQQRRNEQLRLRSMGLEAQNRQIQESNRLKSAFLANMSHELRTPLNAIIGFADLLAMGQVPPDSPKRIEFLGHIRDSGRHLLQLINDVLDLSKVEAGKFDFFPEPVDLPRLIEDAVAVLRTSATAKRVSIAIDVDPTLDDLLLDPSRFKQVLYNYLSNAIKFTQLDGTVTVRAQAIGGGEFRLEVEDTGIGIAPADLQRLFVDFQQLDSSYRKEHPGTGLGLALTKRMVQAQGGRVGVLSTLGVGSTFYAVLPRVTMPAPLPSAAPAQGDPSASPRPNDVDDVDDGAPCILVIEDDAGDEATITAAVTDAGFAVEAAGSAQRALQLAGRRNYAGITLDVLMPGAIGALSALRGNDPGRHTPVLVMTVSDDTVPLTALKVSDVLVKPLRQTTLHDALRAAGLPEGARWTVLAVDGHPESLASLGAALTRLGLQASCHHDGRSALAELHTFAPDAVVVDLATVASDGFAMIDQLRSQPRWETTPLIVSTDAELSAETVQRVAEAAAVLVKNGRVSRGSLLDDVRTLPPPPDRTGVPT